MAGFDYSVDRGSPGFPGFLPSHYNLPPALWPRQTRVSLSPIIEIIDSVESASKAPFLLKPVLVERLFSTFIGYIYLQGLLRRGIPKCIRQPTHPLRRAYSAIYVTKSMTNYGFMSMMSPYHQANLDMRGEMEIISFYKIIICKCD